MNLEDAREFVRSRYGKPQHAQEAEADERCAKVAAAFADEALKAREKQIADELEAKVREYPNHPLEAVLSVRDFIAQLRNGGGE